MNCLRFFKIPFLTIVGVLFIFPQLSYAATFEEAVAALERGPAYVSSDPTVTQKERAQTNPALKFRAPTGAAIRNFCDTNKSISSGNGWVFNDTNYNSCIAWAISRDGLDGEQTIIEQYYQGEIACIPVADTGGCAAGTGIKRTAQDVANAKAESDRKRSAVVPAAVSGAANQLVDQKQAAYDSCVAAKGADNPSCIQTKTELDAAKAAAAQAQTASDNAQKTANPTSCGGLSTIFDFNCVRTLILQIFSSFVLFIPAKILSVAAGIFDISVKFSIIQFKELLSGTAVADGGNSQSAIYLTWVIVRNLFNIVIIFQLLKIAILKILSPFVGKAGDLKKTLVSIIIFTLFTNFSFFFTKALIDFSNITALQFYGAIALPDSTGKSQNADISVLIAQSLGIKPGLIITKSTASEDVDGLASAAAGSVGSGSQTTALSNSFFGTIVVAVLLLIASLILVQGAAIFITRAVVLIFLIIFSPLMFARGILGPLEKWSDKWWGMLLEQLYTAPIYLGMLFLTLKLAGSGEPGGLMTIVMSNGFLPTGSDLTSLAFPAILMGGLFFGTAKLAKDFGGAAAQKSSAWGAKAFGAAVGGAGGLAARKTLGRAANKFSNSQAWSDRAAAGGVKGAIAGGLLNIADKGKKATFDLRNSSAVGRLDKATSGKLGLKDLGTGAKNGFVAERAASDKTFKENQAKKVALLQEDTYGMTDEQKKAAEMRNQDRTERFYANQSLPYSGKETGGEFVTSSKDMEKNISDLQALQSDYDKATQGVKSAELSRDPKKIEEAKKNLEESKRRLDENIGYNDYQLQKFLEDERTKNTDLAKTLENTAGMEEGPAKNAAVRRNMQKIADFKRAQEGINPLINRGLRGASAAWSTVTNSRNASVRAEAKWSSSAKDVRKETVRKRASQEAEDILKTMAWNDVEIVDGKPKKKQGGSELSTPKTKEELKAILDTAIEAHKDNPTVASRYRGAKNKLDGFYKKLNEEKPATADADKAKKPDSDKK